MPMASVFPSLEANPEVIYGDGKMVEGSSVCPLKFALSTRQVNNTMVPVAGIQVVMMVTSSSYSRWNR